MDECELCDLCRFISGGRIAWPLPVPLPPLDATPGDVGVALECGCGCAWVVEVAAAAAMDGHEAGMTLSSCYSCAVEGRVSRSCTRYSCSCSTMERHVHVELWQVEDDDRISKVSVT